MQRIRKAYVADERVNHLHMVVDETGDTHWLASVNQYEVGTQGVVEYRSSGSSGLWYFYVPDVYVRTVLVE